MIVGIANHDEDMFSHISYSKYKMRHFLPVKIPLMDHDEILDIINKRGQVFKIKFESDVKESMANIVRGYPQFMHQLALYACYAWIGHKFVAIGRPIIDKIPVVNQIVNSIFGPPPPVRVNWDISHEELVMAAKTIVKIYNDNFPPSLMAEYRAIRELNETDVAWKVLSIMARNKDEGIELQELAKKVACDECELKSVVSERLRQLVTGRQDGNYKFSNVIIGPYIRLLEYLQQQNAA